MPKPSSSESKAISRRPSAAATGSTPALAVSITSSTTSTRVSRNNDSHHGFVGSHPVNAGPGAFPPANTTGSPQTKAVYALIKRLTLKLPYYSGSALHDIETDTAVLNIIDTLVDLSKHALDIVIWKLSQELESLAKMDCPPELTLALLQSELCLLKVMSVILACRWQHRPMPHKQTSMDSTSDYHDNISTPPAPSPSLASQTQGMRRSHATSGSRISTPSLSLEAPPLDDNCARWLISVMLLLLRQAAPRDDRTYEYDNLSFDATLYGFEAIRGDDAILRDSDMPWIPPSVEQDSTSVPSGADQWPRKTPSMNSFSSSNSSPIPLSRSSLYYQRTPRTLIMASLPLYSLITEWAGKIIYLLSAVNWSVVYGKIRSKIHYLARASSEEVTDYTDLQLMQHCALDRSRLVVIMQELSSLLVNMKPEAQGNVAIYLRRAIWNWIETFPGEFIDVSTGGRRLDGAPERVFDLFIQIKNEQNRKIIWPTLMMLLVLCYERLRQLELRYDGHSWNTKQAQNKKELVFIDKMRKSVTMSSRFSATAIMCYSDLMRAASAIPKDLEVPIRGAASDISPELVNYIRKSQNQRPFYDSTEPIDVAFYADVMIALSRFLPEEEAVNMIMECLEPERSHAVKMVGFKTLIISKLQSAKWRHLPPIETPELRERLKRIYQSTVSIHKEVDSIGVMKRGAVRPTVKRFSSEVIQDSELLVLAILCLVRVNPIFFPTFDQSEDSRVWLSDVIQVLRIPGAFTVPLAILRTYTTDVNWSLKSNDPLFEQLTDWVLVAVPITLHICAVRLLDTRDSIFEQKLMVELVASYTTLYRKVIESGVGHRWDFSEGRLPAIVAVEIAFLVALTSQDTSVATFAARGLREMAVAECIPLSNRQIEESDEAAKRYPVYEQLGDPSFVVVGRVVQQKRIRKLLKLLTYPSPLYACVWYECYFRWAQLKDWLWSRIQSVQNFDIHSSSKPSGDLSMTTEEKFYQWQNLTLFLASFGAASVLGDTSQISLGKYKELPDRLRIVQDGEAMIQDFLSSTVDFLASESAIVRDTAKEALSSELNLRLSGRLFIKLIELVEDISRSFDDSAGHIPEQESLLLLFFDQFLTILKVLVERQDTLVDDVLESPEFRDVINAITKVMDHFRGEGLLRLKIKFCNLIEIACTRFDSFGFRSDDESRNGVLSIVSEWFEPDTITHDDFATMRLRNEANSSAFRATLRLAERLRLQSPDEHSGDDTTHVLGRRFIRYQTILLKGLYIDPTIESSIEEDRSSQHSSSLRKLYGEKEGIKGLLVNALAGLLSMNTNIGLRHFLPLGVDPDPIRRTIFCRVISHVMDQGGRLEVPVDPMVASRRTRIGELVRGCDLILVLAICETCPPAEVDVIIPVLLNIFDTRSSLLELLKLLIEREVKTTTNEVALFRGNSMRMKLLCAFAKIHGYDYLRKLVKPLLDKMCTMDHPPSYILDSSKVSDAEVSDNQRAITLFADAFLTIVCGSAYTMPLMLREICAHISQTVAEYYPDAKYAALGAFIFLRFISPALVSPETIDIDLPSDYAAIRRGLLVITKIMQNLANNVRFGKEAHMMCFNDFLEDNIVRVMRFLTDVNKFAASTMEEDADEWQGGTFDETDAIVLHRFFEKHADKVGKELLSLSKSSKEGEAAVIGGKKAWDTLCGALVEMGQPIEVPRLNNQHSTHPGPYLDFMSRNSDRSTESVREFFRELTVKDDTVFYLLSICQLDVEVLDYELFAYYTYKSMTNPRYLNKSISLIVDCTNYTAASELPLQWFKHFAELTPIDLRSRFSTIYILNCNLPMQRFLRKIYNICSGIFIVELRPKLSVKEICDAVQVDISHALSNAWDLEKEEKDVFPDVMLRQAHVMKVPVKLSVAQSHLRIDSIKALNVYGHFSCRTTDIIPYGDIGDIYNVSTGRDTNEFIIRRSRNGGTLYFSSVDRDRIVKSVRTAKSRGTVVRTVFFDRFSRLSNVKATVLNIAMFNSHDDHPDLRSAAYDLLRSVCACLGFTNVSLLPSSGGHIPGNSLALIRSLSSDLAAFAPQLTLDFLQQVCLDIDKVPCVQKALCLQYASPWIKNLDKFCDPASKQFEPSGVKLRDCIKALLDLTVKDPDFCFISLQYIWPEVGKSSSPLINIALDEITRSAVDGGLGSTRCDVMAEVLSHMSSKSARGRLLAKLRKSLGKTSTKPSRTLDKNVFWNEITTYSKLVLGSGQLDQHSPSTQLFVPEILHLVTLLAGYGDVTMRNTIYGLALQLFQSIYQMHVEDIGLTSEIKALLQDLSRPEVIRFFGLTRTGTIGEFLSIEGLDERECLEGLTRWLMKALTICSGNSGLSNVWRSRWMGLLTSTAFQLSPGIQPRAFIVMGILASSDVDDDLLYQMLVALRSAMRTADESDTQCVVSMLNCICNVVPSLPEGSRYIGTLFWVAVALLESSHAAFYKEANNLLCACVTSLRDQGAFVEKGFIVTLLEARSGFEEILMQLEQLLSLSFDSDFSFSLAAVIFKGMRRPQLRQSATSTLRCLLVTAVSTLVDTPTTEAPVRNEVLGFFLALLSVSTSPQAYQQLLMDARVGPHWLNATGVEEGGMDEPVDELPRIQFDILGCHDSTTALFAITFLGSMLSTAQLDDAESQILFSVLKEASAVYPEIVSLAYDCLQSKIHDIFTSSLSPNLLTSASAVFRVVMEDAATSYTKGSTSTLSTLDEDAAFGQRQKHALEEFNMHGLINQFQFLPMNQGHVDKVLKWFPDLITKIIE